MFGRAALLLRCDRAPAGTALRRPYLDLLLDLIYGQKMVVLRVPAEDGGGGRASGGAGGERGGKEAGGCSAHQSLALSAEPQPEPEQEPEQEPEP
eukprot:COSAG06_NODE_2494_length_6760_cov_2.766136_2_plen_95_part_00